MKIEVGLRGALNPLFSPKQKVKGHHKPIFRDTREKISKSAALKKARTHRRIDRHHLRFKVFSYEMTEYENKHQTRFYIKMLSCNK